MILEGTTSSGAVVPVQVTTDGKVVAEGRTGPEGPQGPEGPEGPQGPEGPAGSPGNLWSGTDPGPIYYTGGLVGIGTSSPSQSLHVNSGITNNIATFESTDAGAVINITDSVGSSSIETNDTQLKIGVDPGNAVAGSDLRLQVDGSTKLLINDSGNVGIGTTSPSVKLDVYEATGGTSCLAEIGASSYGTLQIGVDSDGCRIRAVETSDPICFYTGGSESARIDTSGRLLVGTTTAPAGTLAGDVVCQGAVVLQSPNGMWWAIEVQNDGTLFASQTSVR